MFHESFCTSTVCCAPPAGIVLQVHGSSQPSDISQQVLRKFRKMCTESRGVWCLWSARSRFPLLLRLHAAKNRSIDPHWRHCAAPDLPPGAVLLRTCSQHVAEAKQRVPLECVLMVTCWSMSWCREPSSPRDLSGATFINLKIFR